MNEPADIVIRFVAEETPGSYSFTFVAEAKINDVNLTKSRPSPNDAVRAVMREIGDYSGF